jgi:F-type H+-transporting ATPase subunit alpha
MQVVRTDTFLSIPVGKELLGKVINPLGQSFSENQKFTPPKELREIDTQVLGISSRARIKKPLATGVSIIDMIIPLGKGQRELVIGDRKTGKSTFLLSTIKRQAQEGVITIYAAIGRKHSEIKQLQEFLEQEKILDKAIIVATSSHDSPSLIFLTPYSAITIAEYFRDQGQDVLLVLDDLSAHARFYREISLVGKRFPGRDSYPGDIFYVHAKLIERAGNFKYEKTRDVAITCLPVIETIEGDLTSYVATNLMGMTDGHIFFDSNMYYKGRRPAINTALSVTRVGKQTQSTLKREINNKLNAFLAQHEKLQNFSHFGAELSDDVKRTLRIGDQLYTFFDQHYSLILPEEVQLIVFAMIWQGLFEQEEKIGIAKIKMTELFKKEEYKKFYSELIGVATFDEFIENITKHKDKLV